MRSVTYRFLYGCLSPGSAVGQGVWVSVPLWRILLLAGMTPSRLAFFFSFVALQLLHYKAVRPSPMLVQPQMGPLKAAFPVDI